MTFKKKLFRFLFTPVIIILYVLTNVLTLSSCTGTLTFRHKSVTRNGTALYESLIDNVEGAEIHLPAADKLGEYESVDIFFMQTTKNSSTTKTITVKVTYDKTVIESALNYVNSNYKFLNEAKPKLSDYDATVSSYNIKVVDKEEKTKGEQDEYFYHYPEYFMMIGASGQERAIIYLYHYNDDLYEITDLDKFIKDSYILE